MSEVLRCNIRYRRYDNDYDYVNVDYHTPKEFEYYRYDDDRKRFLTKVRHGDDSVR